MTSRLLPWSVFAAALAAAGLPIYIHAPKFFADTYGVSLATLGAALFALRLLDVVQDPALGWLSARLSARRGPSVAVAGIVMAAAMFGLFAVTPPFAPVLWFALTLALLFSAFSYLTISFYAAGVARASDMGAGGHVRLAAWRETGALIGVCAASVAPTLFALFSDRPFTLFALFFAVLTGVAVLAMRGDWRAVPRAADGPGFRTVLGDATARRLLLVAVLNTAPVAVTSTLFLFFVEARLGLPGWEGPFLLLFFLSAALAAPLWGRIAARIGTKRALQTGMILAIVTFSGALLLGTGDAAAFALICLLSGASLGADMTLLPALFATRMERISPEAAEGFGLWSFASKLTLAFAAAVLLPILDMSGYVAGMNQQPQVALHTLTMLYAGVPLALKALALTLLTFSSLRDGGEKET